MSNEAFHQHGEKHQRYEPHSRVLRVLRFTRWLAVSLLMAWTGPFIVIALLAALPAALLGMLGGSIGDFREIVVSIASAGPAVWSVAKGVWTTCATVFGAGILIWRVFSAAPVERLLDAVTRRIAASAAVVFEPAVERLERLPRAAQASVVLPLAVAAIAGAIMFVNAHPAINGSSVLPPPTPLPIPKTASSAALMLASGAIRTGEAMIEMREDETFVVKFKSDVDQNMIFP